MPTPKQPKKKIVKAWAEMGTRGGVYFLSKKDALQRAKECKLNVKFIPIEISYQLPKRNKIKC